MPKRRNQPATYLEAAENKPDKLDWITFNFLENLFVFCPQRQRSVPPESGVQFGISKGPAEDVLCILFKIDRSPDPLFTDPGQPRPDYLVLYKTSRICIFTIVEMKGRTENGLERGLEQILSLRDRLKREFSEHIPFCANAIFQGILLCPPNSQIPLRRIAKEAEKNFTVVPLLYSQKAELFPYISTQNRITDRYAHQKLTHSEEMSFLEQMLILRAMPHREQDAEYHAQHQASHRTGLYINYALSDAQEYAALITSTAQNRVIVNAEGDEYLSKIKAALAAVGLKTKFECRKLDFGWRIGRQGHEHEQEQGGC